MTLDEFFAAVCERFGWEPTPWRLAVFRFWARQEGMPFELTWNPLATSRLSENTPLNKGYETIYGPGNWNWIPVRVYRDPQAGINATVETLFLDYYRNIRRCFEDQVGHQAAIGDFKTWVGSEAYGARVVNYMNQLSAVKETEDDVITDEELEAAFRRIGKKAGWIDDTGGLVDKRLRKFINLRNRIEALAQDPDAEDIERIISVLEEGGVL